jgi:probable selenium-dependent hydroxylase accessory protein YqeC
MLSLSAFFDFPGPQCITLIGCGGKTSLLWQLALHRKKMCPHEKILVTTTTHIKYPSPDDPYDYIIYDSMFDEAAGTVAQPGITLAGGGGQSDHKFASLPIDALNSIVPCFDWTLIEGDGSRMKPLKGWADYEPVIPRCSTVIVGIVPLWPLGEKAGENLVHRLTLFTRLTGVRENETLALPHYIPLICGNAENGARGLFSAYDTGAGGAGSTAVARKILFFNQIEDAASTQNARSLAALLPPDFRASLDYIIAGSIHLDRVEVLLSNL